jgi:bacteriocin biosynthesis cyclodehydratase domain-containing protein
MLKKGYEIFEDRKHNIYQIRNGIDVISAEFNNDEERQIFEIIITELKKPKPQKLENIVNNLYKSHAKEKVYNVINQLNDFDLLEDDSLYEIFNGNLDAQLSFWSLNSGAPNAISAQETQERIKNTKLLLLGTGVFLNLIENKAKLSGFENITIVKISSELNEDEIISSVKQSDFFIYDADEWNPFYLELVNKTAVENNKPWILFNGVQNLKASVGPLFVGRETGCYHCLLNRIKSNIEFLPYFNEYEKHLLKDRQSGQRQGAPIVLYDIAASICMLEALKYITEWTIPILYKNFITINAMGLETKIHPFLKAPVCDVCTPNLEFNSAPWLEPVTLKN